MCAGVASGINRTGSDIFFDIFAKGWPPQSSTDERDDATDAGVTVELGSVDPKHKTISSR